jgi:hypothetical protein
MAKKRPRKARVVFAPEPTLSPACVPNRVLSVVLRPGEQVRWIWTSGPEGQYVSGYTITKTRALSPRRRRPPLDEPGPAIERLWAKEAEERLAAYRRGEIKAVPLEEVLAKYRVK